MRCFPANLKCRQHCSVLNGGQQVADSDRIGTVRDGQTVILKERNDMSLCDDFPALRSELDTRRLM